MSIRFLRDTYPVSSATDEVLDSFFITGNGSRGGRTGLSVRQPRGEFRMVFRLNRELLIGIAIAIVGGVLAMLAPTSFAAPTCAALATDPASGFQGHASIKTVTSMIVPAANKDVSYCKVSLLYGTNSNQNINIVIGLPLSTADGGTGKIEGAWNGRTEGLGGGGCSGTLNVLRAVNDGYVGSATDLGHMGGDCTPGVNVDGTYNMQFIEDFIRNAIKQQVLLSKSIAEKYYAMRPKYNYWNGCSTGGRQGLLLAQELPNELDGILANAPAINWTKFQTAQMSGQIAMKQLTGGPIAKEKLDQTRASAIAACDGNDGVMDGIIDDPRSCHFSAKSNICGTETAPLKNCLSLQEAQAIDEIWDGPHNVKGEKVWFGLERGTDFSGLNGQRAFELGVVQMEWDERDVKFNWETVSLKNYAKIAQDGSNRIADVTDTIGPLDDFNKHGGKLITWVGGNDQLIFPEGVISYYRQLALNRSKNDTPDFAGLQSYYRLFRAPGVGHCGGGAGPTPTDAFSALVNWVEQGKAPDTLNASGGSAAPATGRTRPLCPYPQTAIYWGTGDTNDAANFKCGGNLETKEIVCSDLLATYKHEVDGPLDYRGAGADRKSCEQLQVSKN